MSFYLNTNDTQDPLSEGQHSDQQRDSDIVMKKIQLTAIIKV